MVNREINIPRTTGHFTSLFVSTKQTLDDKLKKVQVRLKDIDKEILILENEQRELWVDRETFKKQLERGFIKK